MSAVPVNDDDRPLGVTAFQIVRNLPALPAEDLKLLLAHVVGHLVERAGIYEASAVAANVVRAAVRSTAPMSLHDIAFFVAAKHGVTVADLRAPSDDPGSMTDAVAIPRQKAFWLARQQQHPDGRQKFSFPMIGLFFGGRDHSTVVHGVRKHRDRLLREAI